jgi:hypothetical protein
MEMKSSNDIDKEQTGVELRRVKLAVQFKPFVRVLDELFKRGRYLTPSAKWLFVVLRSFANNQTGEIYPSYQAIMKKSGLTKNAVAKGLSELEHFQWLFRQKAKGKGNNYILYYPSFKDAKSEEETGNQVYPTKEMAQEWARSRRPKKRIPSEGNNRI